MTNGCQQLYIKLDHRKNFGNFLGAFVRDQAENINFITAESFIALTGDRIKCLENRVELLNKVRASLASVCLVLPEEVPVRKDLFGSDLFGRFEEEQRRKAVTQASIDLSIVEGILEENRCEIGSLKASLREYCSGISH